MAIEAISKQEWERALAAHLGWGQTWHGDLPTDVFFGVWARLAHEAEPLVVRVHLGTTPPPSPCPPIVHWTLITTARGWTVVSGFVDPGITGQTLDRPGLQNMLTAAEQGAFDAVIVHKPSRLSRSSVYDTFSIFDQLGRCKVQFA
jgi:hypothetical protein